MRYKNLNHVHERSEAGRDGIPLRKIEVPCSDDVADSRLRIVGQDVRLPKTSVSCIVRTQYPYFAQRYAGITGFGPLLLLLLN